MSEMVIFWEGAGVGGQMSNILIIRRSDTGAGGTWEPGA